MPNPTSPSYLEQAIFNTVRYFALFSLPVTATQIWRSLVIPPATTQLRWDGHALYSLSAVQQALTTSVWLKQHLETEWGYYCLPGERLLVRERLWRHTISQDKWKIVSRAAKLLSAVPFVRSLSVAGSVAQDNAKVTSDLDMFVIARHGRIWTARLLLLAVTQLLGRRRRHWDEQAPDKVCLNHYITDESLLMTPEIRTVFTAVEYTHHVPLTGHALYRSFHATNDGWFKRFLMYPEAPALASTHAVATGHVSNFIKKILESILLEPLGTRLERWAEAVQRRSIARHTEPNQSGRVVVSPRELAFHPHSKVEGLLQRFTQDAGQQALL
ncbi:MAG: hypothetical protein WD972_01945, partial [Candidatus Andersenbacteria bacterium]